MVIASSACSDGGSEASPDGSSGRRLRELVAASGFEDPADVELPPVADSSARAWLEGEGAGAVQLVVASEDLWATGEAACDRTSEALDEAGKPEELLAAAAGTPDPPTQELLVGLHTAVGSALQACTDTATFEPAVAQLAWQWALSDRRLDELGVDR